jgi:asparagine synthase (glutamine-hydrolysing)
VTAIYGLWRFDDRDLATDFRRMDLALSRYGSDDHESWSADSAVMLGRRLHRSLPEDHFRTPVATGARYVTFGDVRLTERENLMRELRLGEDAARMSDAAIAAAAVEAWNEEAFDRIYGVFAIAAWDTRERRLMLARDHMGLKPLFFHFADRFFAFASMPAGLLALPDIPRRPDMESMRRFLAVENHSAGKTHYESIERVMPGHFAIVTSAGVTQTRYWQPDLTPLRLPTSDDYVDALSEHLDCAVAAALRGIGTQVGAHLSSGFDSTAVATTAARQLASSGGTVVAYTAAPREGYEKTRPNRTVDESVLARATAAQHPNMRHVIVRSDRTPMANLDRTASIYGIPVLNICNEGWYDAINDDAARRGIAVILEAPMGNATISEDGILALPELLRAGRIVSWLKLAMRMIRRRSTSLRRILWHSFSPWIPDGLYSRLIEHRYGALVSASRFSPLKDEHLRVALRDAASESPIPGAQERFLPSGWTRPSARSLDNRLALLSGDESGASCKGILGEWKIDYRDPTADRRLVEFSLRVPTEQLIHDGAPRALLRKVLADRAPPEVLANPNRGYQAADWHEWLDDAREEIIDQIERIEMFEPTAELVDVDRLRALVRDWPERGAEFWTDPDAVVDYRCCLLRAISAASFMRQAAGSNY